METIYVDGLNSNRYFHISDYRKFTGYSRKNHYLQQNAKVLCFGSCDLESIRPDSVSIFNWADHLTQLTSCNQIDKVISIDDALLYFEEYLRTYAKPECVCYSMPIMTESVMLNDKIMVITENSARVIQYLYKKQLIDELMYEDLLHKVSVLKSSTNQERIEYAVTRINSFKSLCSKNNIKFLWCTNGTKTANNFYKSIIDNILSRLPDKNGYTGWIENIDVQPDSSMGPKTQEKIFESFRKFI